MLACEKKTEFFAIAAIATEYYCRSRRLPFVITVTAVDEGAAASLINDDDIAAAAVVQ